MMTHDEKRDLTLEETVREEAPWALHGIEYEDRVIEELSQNYSVMRPPNEEKLTRHQSHGFLRQATDYRFAHQLRLESSHDGAFRRIWSVPQGLTLSPVFPDLVEVVVTEDAKQLRLIDIKATQHAAVFHKIQVAYYAVLLQAMLEDLALDQIHLHEYGQIWHAVPEGDKATWTVTEFRLRGYVRQVMEFLEKVVPATMARHVGTTSDDTRFHLYFKCEQCKWLPHCWKSINSPDPANWNVSAVPGLSITSKRVLEKKGISSVGEFARFESKNQETLNWGLQRKHELLQGRAKSLCTGISSVRGDTYTYLMPPRFDWAVYLLVDRNPISGRLATLGCLLERDGRQEYKICVLTKQDESEELHALVEIALFVGAFLSQADTINESDGNVHLHLFVYEPAEAEYLAEAFSRHLDSSEIRSTILQLLRIFPPEEIPREPEYSGQHHLPATSLRSVVEGLLILPIRVSYDLRNVTEALNAADPPLQHPYRPAKDFARPFSSMLDVGHARRLQEGDLSPHIVEINVKSRLAATASLARWLETENNSAEIPFLRLQKTPFRFQQTFNPLNASDLELLEASELLQNCKSRLSALIALSERWELRVQKGKCYACLRLVSDEISPRQWSERRLKFVVPTESHRSEIEPGSFAVILHNDDPDMRLDPSLWLFVDLITVDEEEGEMTLTVDVPQMTAELPKYRQLRETCGTDGFFLDLAHRDFTTSRLVQFLRFLSDEEA